MSANNLDMDMNMDLDLGIFNSPEDKEHAPVNNNFTITLDDYEWSGPIDHPVQKSDYLHALITGGYREATNRQVALHDDDPIAFARFMVWAVHADYPLYASCITTEGIAGALWSLLAPGREMTAVPPLLTEEEVIKAHVDVFVVADKYGVSELRAYCTDRITGIIRGPRGDWKQVWVVAERAKEMVSSSRDLDGFVRDWLLLNLEHYQKQQDGRLEEYATENGEFGWEVIKRLKPLGGGPDYRLYGLEVVDDHA